jgi:ferredoxin-type protein NapH
MSTSKISIISMIVFVCLVIILGLMINLNWISSIILALFGASINFVILKNTKDNKTRIILFCAWGVLFAFTTILANSLQHGQMICPSKIALVGEKAGIVPLIPGTTENKALLPCPMGILQNYQSVIEKHGFLLSAISLSIKMFGFIFFLWLLMAIIFGRSWCGWICPFGGLNEAMTRLGKKPYWEIDLTRNTYRGLRYGFFVGLLLLLLATQVSPSFPYCIICPFKGIYHTPDYLGKIFIVATEFITYSLFIAFFIIIPFLTKKRIWCTLFCPLGVLTSLLSKFSLIETKIDLEKCPNCKVCAKKCKMDIFSKENGEKIMSSSSCTNCGDCMSYCPKDAIKYRIRNTNIEVKQYFIPIMVVMFITIAAILANALWQPLFKAILKLFN